ncbi:hypothetical protein P171DRAFT_21489 [Karstenula rhodostoma CBS 690.94]|uniref:Uncharacterized protein n=1 Tax=Karstenula rhodostoma CBS 690.94 TaxID=1392251 RepID=A0A9P4UK04_9PLEO|nr:hypothetical protein P171DRAFT_21489 [Karstenula rhodostoma CBS 690.94]
MCLYATMTYVRKHQPDIDTLLHVAVRDPRWNSAWARGELLKLGWGGEAATQLWLAVPSYTRRAALRGGASNHRIAAPTTLNRLRLHVSTCLYLCLCLCSADRRSPRIAVHQHYRQQSPAACPPVRPPELPALSSTSRRLLLAVTAACAPHLPTVARRRF